MPKITSKVRRAWKERASEALGMLQRLDGASWTDEQIAQALGISFNTVRRWRSGTTPQGTHLALLRKLSTGVGRGEIKRPVPLVA